MDKKERSGIMENTLIRKYCGFQEVKCALEKGRRIVPFTGKIYLYNDTMDIHFISKDEKVMGYIEKIRSDKFSEYKINNIAPNFSNINSIRVVSFEGGESTKILYYYANPQMNRTFCKCSDGTSHEYPINIIDSMEFYDYEDYVASKKDKDVIEVTISELEKMIGKKIKIKG